MTALRYTPLMRHGALWRSDARYRWAWLVWPQLAGLLAIGWLFATPHVNQPPVAPGTWIHPIHPPEETAALKQLRDQAVADPGARAQLEQKANAGNSLAQFYMGTLFDPKLPFASAAPDKIGEAIAWYRKAADQGVDTAASNWGLLLLVGEHFGIATDYDEARKLFEKAAPTVVVARRELGLMKQRGWGEPADPVGGMQMIRAAAERGDAFSQRLVAEALDQGLDGLAIDHHDAFFWMQKAALQNDVVAERELGMHLKKGDGIEPDAVAATIWLKKAADQGDIPAKEELNSGTQGP